MNGKIESGKIESASAWILRCGVLASVVVMLAGAAISFVDGQVSDQQMRQVRFDYRPAVICRGIFALDGQAIVEAGIYLLLLTPILRVAVSMALFAFCERDRVYALLTLGVLVLTLAGLVLLK